MESAGRALHQHAPTARPDRRTSRSLRGSRGSRPRTQRGTTSTPLTEIQGWSEVPRGTRLFDSILVFENYPIGGSSRAGHSAAPGPVLAFERTNYALMLVEPGPPLALKILYDTDLFDEATIVRLARHYETLLAGAVADPERPLARCPPHARGAAHAHRRVEPDGAPPGRARARPRRGAGPANAGAPACARASAPYRELEEGANRLAHRLRAAGVGRDVPVALCLPRSPELVVAMLAVLKAGGAYVPLDPAYPPPRLAFMLADTSAPSSSPPRRSRPCSRPGPRPSSSSTGRDRARPLSRPRRGRRCARATSPTSSTPPAPPGPRRASWQPTAAPSTGSGGCRRRARSSRARCVVKRRP